MQHCARDRSRSISASIAVRIARGSVCDRREINARFACDLGNVRFAFSFCENRTCTHTIKLMDPQNPPADPRDVIVASNSPPPCSGFSEWPYVLRPFDFSHLPPPQFLPSFILPSACLIRPCMRKWRGTLFSPNPCWFEFSPSHPQRLHWRVVLWQSTIGARVR